MWTRVIINAIIVIPCTRSFSLCPYSMFDKERGKKFGMERDNHVTRGRATTIHLFEKCVQWRAFHFFFFVSCDCPFCGDIVVGRQPMNLQTGRIKLKQVRQHKEKQHRFICTCDEKGEERGGEKWVVAGRRIIEAWLRGCYNANVNTKEFFKSEGKRRMWMESIGSVNW